MEKQLCEKDALTVSVLRDQINQCRDDITAYNTQFLASSTLCAVTAAFAAVLCTATEGGQIWNLFYLLPSVYFMSVYNIIKYTNEQLKLGAYRMVLEHLLNAYLSEPVLWWEAKANIGLRYILFGAIAVVFFVFPISVFMLWGFWQLPKNWIWFVIGVFLLFQVVIMIAMGFNLLVTKKETLKNFGYRLQEDRTLAKIDQPSSVGCQSQ